MALFFAANQNSNAGLTSLRRCACTMQSFFRHDTGCTQGSEHGLQGKVGRVILLREMAQGEFLQPLWMSSRSFAEHSSLKGVLARSRCGRADSRGRARCAACAGRSCFPAPQGRSRKAPRAPVGSGCQGRWRWSWSYRPGCGCGSPRRAHRGWWGRTAPPKQPMSSSLPSSVFSSQLAGTISLASRKSSVAAAPYTGSGFFFQEGGKPLDVVAVLVGDKDARTIADG